MSVSVCTLLLLWPQCFFRLFLFQACRPNTISSPALAPFWFIRILIILPLFNPFRFLSGMCPLSRCSFPCYSWQCLVPLLVGFHVLCAGVSCSYLRALFIHVFRSRTYKQKCEKVVANDDNPSYIRPLLQCMSIVLQASLKRCARSPLYLSCICGKHFSRWFALSCLCVFYYVPSILVLSFSGHIGLERHTVKPCIAPFGSRAHTIIAGDHH